MIDEADWPEASCLGVDGRCVPLPSAPYGTLLHSIQLARWETRAISNQGGHGESRRLCLHYAKTHAGLLRGVVVSEAFTKYIRVAVSPWEVMLDLIRKAMRPERKAQR